MALHLVTIFVIALTLFSSLTLRASILIIGSPCIDILGQGFEKSVVSEAAPLIFSANSILFLTEQQYRDASVRSKIPVDAALVMESLPLDVNLPVVAGILLSKPLATSYSHPEKQAQALKIPIIITDGIFDSTQLQGLALKKDSGFTFYSDNGGLKIDILNAQKILAPPSPAYFPPAINRSPRALVTHRWRRKLRSAFSRAILGDKFYELDQTTSFLKQDQVPNFATITSGYYEFFISNYGINGRSLRNLRPNPARYVSPHQAQSFDPYVEMILKAEPVREEARNESIFNELFQQLVDLYGQGVWISLRSNSDIEVVLNTAGLFESTKFQLGSAADVEAACKKIWASMFTQDSYRPRARLGIVEDNLSMPLLVHPYIDNVLAHAVVHIDRNRQNSSISRDDIHVSLVEGATEKATNPSASAKIHQFTLSPQTQKNVPQEAARAINGFFNSYVLREIESDLKTRALSDGMVEMEIAVRPGDPTAQGRARWPQVMVLQYSVPISPESIGLILDGKLPASKLDQRIFASNAKNISDLMKIYGFFSLRQHVLSRDLYEGRVSASFLILSLPEESEGFIFWNTGVPHTDTIKNVKTPSTKYLEQGGMTLIQTPQENIFHFYIYLESSSHIKLNEAKNLVVKALLREFKRDPALMGVLKSLGSQPFNFQFDFSLNGTNPPPNFKLSLEEIESELSH